MGDAVRNIEYIRGPNPHRKFSVIIPAAGEGRRMASYDPKPLIKVNNVTILQRQVEIIKATFKKFEIIVVGGFKYSRIVSNCLNGVNYINNTSYEDNNVCLSIKLGLEQAKYSDILVVYGDLVFNSQAISYPFNNDSTLVIDKYKSMKNDEVGCVVDNSRILSMSYGLEDKWAQIMYLTGKELSIFRKFLSKEKNKRAFGFEAINYIIDSGGNFNAYCPSKMKIIDVDCSKDIVAAERMIK